MRRGLTLLELLLVLALLGVIGSLAVPLMQGGFATVGLQRAGDQVLAAWSQARTTAIETGTVQQFRYEQQGARFRREPYPSVVESSDVGEDLSRAIVFDSGRAINESFDTDERLVQLNTQEHEWSSPVLFYPDGTSSSATVSLKTKVDKKATPRYLMITLRGLTGVGRKSQVLTASEWQEASSQ